MGQLQTNGGCLVTDGVFRSQIDRLRVLRFPPADFNSHWDALQDIPDEAFTAGVSFALRSRVEFPTPAELRADVDAAHRHVHRAIGVHPTSRMVPLEGGIPVTIRNPFAPDGSADVHLQVADVFKPDCDECDDTGQVAFWCGEQPSARWPWLYRRSCDRRTPHADHEWAGPCPCAATNPTIQRRKAAAGAKYAEEPVKVGR